jgi:hypothetical protein
LKDIPAPGGVPRLTPDQLASLATIVEVGPDRAKNGAATLEHFVDGYRKAGLPE